MDIEEFEKNVQPKAKRSKLEPFHAQIFELRSKGYANWQISEWLATNSILVTQESVRKFIKSRENDQRALAPQPQVEKIPATTPGETRKITNPSDIRNSRRRNIDLDDFS